MAVPFLPTALGLVFAGAATAAAWLGLRILADARREPPEIPEEVRPHKLSLNRGLRIEGAVMFGLLTYGFVRLLGNHALEAAGCDAVTGALRALITLDHVLMALGSLAWIGGLGWSIRHVVRLRAKGWADPKARDTITIHLTLVPIALIAFAAALTVNANRFCT